MAAKKAAAQKPAAAAEVGSEIYLDPELAKIRDAEMAKLAAIEITPRQDATLDPELAKIRDAEMKRAPRVF